MGPSAVNEDEFTGWSTCLKVLGLIFDTVAVAMLASKRVTTTHLVPGAIHGQASRAVSIELSWDHFAMPPRASGQFAYLPSAIVWANASFIAFQRVILSTAMRDDLQCWWQVLDSPPLIGTLLTYFESSPAQDTTILIHASDKSICAIVPSLQLYLKYRFSPPELRFIAEFHQGASNVFDINYREFLSRAIAVQTWTPLWNERHNQASPLHIHFRIDNTSVISWQSKVSSSNTCTQLSVRLLGVWSSSSA